MHALLDDARYALRLLARSPAFTAVAVLSLALGIGANTAIFSVVNAVLLRPLPFRDAGQLVDVMEVTPRGGKFAIAPANFIDWREQNQVFADMALLSVRSLTVLGAGEPRLVPTMRVSASFFPLLGVAPALGRAFTSAEDAPGAYGVAVVSHEFWQQHLGGTREALGTPLTIDGESYTVIGVMPAGFRFLPWTLQRTDVWMPYPFARDPPADRAIHRLNAIARLKPGISLDEAQRDLDRVAQNLARAHPATNKDWGVRLTPWHENLVGKTRGQLWLLMGAVGLVLLIACTNLANLLLARATQRQREIAVRAALGASRWRLIRQLLTESALLAAIGGALGLVFAYWGTKALIALSPGNIPRLDEAGLDLRALGFTVVAAAVTALIFGVVPALQGSRPELNHYLKDAGASASYRRQRLCSAFVAIEIALAVALLAGAGLLLNSFLKYQVTGQGYDASNAVTLRVNLARTKYAEPVTLSPTETSDVPIPKGMNVWKVRPEQQAFIDGVIGRTAALPGVEAVGAVNYLPFGRLSVGAQFTVDGRPPVEPKDQPAAWFRPVTPGYLRAMGIPLLRGRHFTAHDNETSAPVVIVSEAIAREFWPEGEALGQRLRFKDGRLGRERSFEIIGITGNTRQNIENMLSTSPGNWGRLERVLYFPYRQQVSIYPDFNIGSRLALSFVARTGARPEPVAEAFRAAVRELDPEQPIEQLTTVKQLAADTDKGYRFNVILLGLFAGLAAALAGIGVYGLMNYAVTQRTREIGVRMALGAAPRDVVRLVLGRGLALTCIGIAAGLGLALGLTRVLAALLYEVSPNDAATFAGVAVAAVVVSLAGCCGPVRRALGVDPIAAIRYE